MAAEYLFLVSQSKSICNQKIGPKKFGEKNFS